MKRIALLLTASIAHFAASLGAETGLSLGAFSDSARYDLEQKIRKTLSDKGKVRRVAGVVTVITEEGFFIQSDFEGLKVICNRSSLPRVGDVVNVVCHAALDGGRVVAVADSWKKTASAELPSPLPIGASRLFYVGNNRQGVNGLLVAIEGRAMALTESGFAIDVEGSPVTVAVDELPNFLENCDKVHPLVTVTGVAELILDQAVLFSRPRQVIGVKVYATGNNAIQLNVDPVYLVNCRDRRVTMFVGLLIALLSIGIVFLLIFSFRQMRRQLRTKTLMEERKRMADDIHDTIEQHLVGAGMLMQIGKIPEAHEILVRAKKEIRDIIWGLKNDDMMRLSPAELIRKLAHEEAKKGLYRVTARIEWMPETMDASRMRDLSLIVREAIGNAVKHGGARKIAISSVSKPDGGWLLRIANDGTPFDEASAPGVKEGHFGLEGMRERGRRLGARVSFSQKGEWTVVSIDVEGK